ncbi:MAG TPA: TetR/AcrR family transcriptional regulator [Acidimicrobiales bacterium]|nr:TetR/AcrR family transcriptional regulator [Acidimicrobiales bacterium]
MAITAVPDSTPAGASVLSKGERTRAAVLASAVRRFAEGGLRATSVSDVARDVGITPAAVYAYFPSKSALFYAAADADAEALIREALEEVFSEERLEDWEPLFIRLVEGMDKHPLARRILSGGEGPIAERLLELPALVSLRREIARVIVIGQRADDVRTDIDPVLMAAGLETVVLALLMGVLQTGGSITPSRVAGVRELMDAALHTPVSRARATN